MEKREDSAPFRKSRKFRILTVLAVLVLLVSAAVILFLHFWQPEVVPPPAMALEDIQFPPNTEHIGGEDSGLVNILLIGQDRRITQGRMHSDVMILCTFDTIENRVVLTTFMRDLMVDIPDYGKDRLNVSYKLGGMELLDQTIEHNFGVHIDGNVEVDFSHFMNMVDAMGGVTVEVTEEEAGEINRMLEIDEIEPGLRTLTGIQALAYCRTRSLDSDFGRTGRQRRVVSALYDRAREMSTGEVMALAAYFLPYVSTDMELPLILSYSQELLPVVKSAEIETLRIPVDEGYTDQNVNGSWVLVPDMEKNREELHRGLLGTEES